MGYQEASNIFRTTEIMPGNAPYEVVEDAKRDGNYFRAVLERRLGRLDPITDKVFIKYGQRLVNLFSQVYQVNTTRLFKDGSRVIEQIEPLQARRFNDWRFGLSTSLLGYDDDKLVGDRESFQSLFARQDRIGLLCYVPQSGSGDNPFAYMAYARDINPARLVFYAEQPRNPTLEGLSDGSPVDLNDYILRDKLYREMFYNPDTAPDWRTSVRFGLTAFHQAILG